MKIKKISHITVILFTLLSSPLAAQNDYLLINNNASSCTKQALEDMINAINKYRAESRNWNSTVSQFEFTLGGVSESERGLLELPVNDDLMFSAYETARKFADGTYPVWDHEINGEGATMRAIKDGWSPSMNKIFAANQHPVFTMLGENLYFGSSDFTWQHILNGWEGSPGHNTTLLSRGAVSIGCGCADTKPDKDGDRNTYWVLLIEIENGASESDEVMMEYFRRGVFYKVKDGMANAQDSKHKAYEVFEFIPSGLERIRNEK